jgi:hypothetical protein
VGGQFSDIELLDAAGNASFSPGFGGRFDWNMTPRIALDAQIDFFLRGYSPSQQQGGRTFQFLAGVRGRIVQQKRYAIYGLMRPGLTYSSKALKSFSATTTDGSQPIFLSTPNYGGVTHFTIDLGGGVEFYPAERWIFRAEIEASPYFVGDTPLNYTFAPPPEEIRTASTPETVTNTWRVSTGMSYRPGEVQPNPQRKELDSRGLSSGRNLHRFASPGSTE